MDVVLPSGLSREEAIRSWTYPLEGTGQSWDALPPGTYQIVVRTAKAAAGNEPPTDVGEVVLAHGDHQTVDVVLPGKFNDPGRASPRLLTVHVPTTDDVSRLSIAQWLNGVRTVIEPTARQLQSEVVLTISARCSAGSVLVVESPRVIGAATLDGNCAGPIRVPVSPRADVVARLRLGHSAPRLPATGWFHLATCGNDRIRMEIPVTIANGHIRAALPADCSAWSLRAGGFVPIRIPGERLRIGEKRDLGELPLHAGAAAVIRVRSDRNGELAEGVRVAALREDDVAAVRGETEIESLVLDSGVTDASGWARLAGLPQERLVFLLHGPGRRHPQVSEPYELTVGEETVIDDLVLPTPASVAVTLSMPENVREALAVQEIALESAGPNQWPSRLPLRGDLTATGAIVEDVPPGTWKVRAAGRLANGYVLRLRETTVDVVAGMDRHVTLSVDDVLFHGRVTRGGTPVSGTLNLRPADRRGGRRSVVAPIDAHGRFEVLLEGEGSYTVVVQDKSGRMVTLGRYVSFEDSEDVEIELPTGEIRGRVVDSAGRPLPQISVSAHQQIAEPAGGAGARSSRDGSFVIDGVTPGTWELVAEAKDLRSAPVVVSVAGDTLDGVTLFADPTRLVRLRLVNVAGFPVPNAFVSAEIPRPLPLSPHTEIRMTRADGTAEFKVPATPDAFITTVVVMTEDQRLSCALVSFQTDIAITVPAAFAELRLFKGERASGGKIWLLSPTGCAVPFLGTRTEIENGQRAFVFPKLAAGTWSYVETHTPEEELGLLTGRSANLTRIKTFNVAPAATTRITIPIDQS